MRRTLLSLGLLAAGLPLGCGTVEHDTRVPRVTEFTTAPKEPRYDKPRELEYSKPAPKKEFKPGVGSASAPGGGMGGIGQ